jgi:hypothetical protein
MAIELITFDAGINQKKKNALLLKEGEMQTCEGFNFKHDSADLPGTL